MKTWFISITVITFCNLLWALNTDSNISWYCAYISGFVWGWVAHRTYLSMPEKFKR